MTAVLRTSGRTAPKEPKDPTEPKEYDGKAERPMRDIAGARRGPLPYHRAPG